MNKFIYYTITFLVIYLPFEDFILKIFPISDINYLILRQFVDIAIILIFIIIFLSKILLSRKLDNLALLLIIFILYSLFLTYINSSNYADAILNIKALVRFMLLYFIVYWLHLPSKRIYNLLKIMVFVIVLQSLIGILEYFGSEVLISFFSPRQLNTSMYNLSFTALNNVGVFGTMAYTINFGLFMMMGVIIIWILEKELLKKSYIRNFILFLLFFATYASGSRASLFIIFIGIFLYIKKQKKYIKLGIPSMLLILFLLVINIFSINLGDSTSTKDFSYFMSAGFIENLRHQRLGMMEMFFINMQNLDFIGLSPDKDFVIEKLSTILELPILLKATTLQYIEDVYWLALFFYYGAIGLLIFVYILYSIYCRLDTNFKMDMFEYKLVIIAKILLILMIPLNFFNQVFEIKQFSFYFWIIVGMAQSIVYRRR